MAQEIETARFTSTSELPPDLDHRPWVDLTQTYLSPFPADENFPEIAHGELRLRHTVNHLGEQVCLATAKFGDKRDGHRIEVETELAKGSLTQRDSPLLERLAYGIVQKRRYLLGDDRVVDVLDPALHGDVVIEEQEYTETQAAPAAASIIPLNRELAVPIANTMPRLVPSSKEDLLAAIERRYRRKGKLLITVSGMSGSGKTTLAKELASDIGATHIQTDDFHIGSRNMAMYQGLDSDNHDHPRVYDYWGAGEAACRIMEGNEAITPQYDFATAERSREQRYIPGNDKGLVVVEGLYAKNSSGVASLTHDTLNILVDRPPYVCVLRRLLRDSAEELSGLGDGRGGIFTTAAGSLKYIMETALPTYLRHQAPAEEFDVIA